MVWPACFLLACALLLLLLGPERVFVLRCGGRDVVGSAFGFAGQCVYSGVCTPPKKILGESGWFWISDYNTYLLLYAILVD